MKKLLLTLLFCPTLLLSQQDIDTNWAIQINQIFQHLDKSKVSSGHLLDYAMEFTDITAYDGVVRDTNYVDVNVLGNIYKTLYMAKTTIDTTHTPQFQKVAYDLAQHVYQKNLMDKNNIVLTGLLYEYQQFNPNALSQNKITVSNNKYYDKYINGVWQNPYDTKYTTAVATSTNKSSSRTLKFILPSNLLLSNKTSQISSIEIDFDNGQGWQNLTLNQYRTINFTQNKVYEFKTRFNLTNGQQLISRTKFKINDPELTKGLAKSGNTAQKVRISEGIPFTSSYRGADLTIRRMPANMASGNITRPLVIVEGFDTGHITDPADEDGDTGLQSFDRSIITAFAGNQLNNLLTGTTQQYDIIYVDWIKGTGDMIENSAILKQVIEWINNEKTGSESNVVLGQSMGGVIARYTLAKWEQDDANFDQNNPQATSPHNVRLFIAHDSPMQGANTPLSIQHFSRHMKLQYVQSPLALATGEVILPIAFNLTDTVSDFINLLGANTTVDPYVSPLANLSLNDTPAARQLHYWSLDTWSHSQTQSFYNNWQNELNSKGYPIASRNVAISNGNECADNHGFNPGDLLFKIDDADNPDFIGDLLNMIGVPLLNVARPLDFGLIIVGILPGKSKWQYNFDFYATPELGSEDRIYRGRIRYEKTLLWIGPTVNYDLTNRTFDAPATALPYDSYAGGHFELNPWVCRLQNDGTTSCGFEFAIDLPNQVPPIEIFHRQYGFIPTVSALDIVKTNGTEVDPIDYVKTTAGGVIQDSGLVSNFDGFAVDLLSNNRGNDDGNLANPGNYFNANNEHISFQVRNGNWLADELNADPANGIAFPVLDDCSAFCTSTAEISGEDILCTTGTYSVTSAATTVNWSVTDPDNLVSFSTNGNVLTLTQLNPNNYGIVTLSVFYENNDCGSITLTKDIEVGILPNRLTNASITGNEAICDTQNYTYTIGDFTHTCVTSVTWSVSPNLNIVSQNATSVTVTRNTNNNQYAGLITANLPNSIFTIEKGIWVGVPSNDGLAIQKIGAYDLYAGRWSKLRALYNPLIYMANAPLNVTYEWQIPHSMVRNYADTAYKDVKPNIGGQLNIGVRAVCDCGNGVWKYRLFEVGGGTGPNELIPIGGH